MPALITAADIEARVPPDEYLKLYDRDGDGVADAAFVTTCITTADSRVRMQLYAHVGAPDAAGGTVDEAIKAACVSYACLEAVLYTPLYSDAAAAPYKAGADRADKFLERLAKDDRARVVTANTGRARPVASVSNATDADGLPTNPLGRAASGRDPSAY
jgi:hypothetical protein